MKMEMDEEYIYLDDNEDNLIDFSSKNRENMESDDESQVPYSEEMKYKDLTIINLTTEENNSMEEKEKSEKHKNEENLKINGNFYQFKESPQNLFNKIKLKISNLINQFSEVNVDMILLKKLVSCNYFF